MFPRRHYLFNIRNRQNLWDTTDDDSDNDEDKRTSETTSNNQQLNNSQPSHSTTISFTDNSSVRTAPILLPPSSPSPSSSSSFSIAATTSTATGVEIITGIEIATERETVVTAEVPKLIDLTINEYPLRAPYVPRTIQANDTRRYSILPAFPTTFYNDQPSLLLANVPGMFDRTVYLASYEIQKGYLYIYCRFNFLYFI